MIFSSHFNGLTSIYLNLNANGFTGCKYCFSFETVSKQHKLILTLFRNNKTCFVCMSGRKLKIIANFIYFLFHSTSFFGDIYPQESQIKYIYISSLSGSQRNCLRSCRILLLHLTITCV